MLTVPIHRNLLRTSHPCCYVAFHCLLTRCSVRWVGQSANGLRFNSHQDDPMQKVVAMQIGGVELAHRGWPAACTTEKTSDAHVPLPRCPLQIPYTQEDYEAAKARDPEFYRGADSLEYGKAPAVPEENIDKMVAELDAKYASGRAAG